MSHNDALERARASLREGRAEQAVDLLSEALQAAHDNAQSVELLTQRAEAHLVCVSPAAARADAAAALAADASCARAWMLKARALHVEGDVLRAEAHAACALQLEPSLQDDPLCLPWMHSFRAVHLDADDGEKRGSDFTRLDTVAMTEHLRLVNPSVLVLGPGTHYASVLLLRRRMAIIGLGAPGEIRLVDKPRPMASTNTVYVEAPPSQPLLLENLHISCSQEEALLVVSGRVAVHGCTFSTKSLSRPAASAVGGELSLTDCTVDGSGAGGIMAAKQGVVSLRRCTVHNCGMNGVEAVDGGSLTAEDVCSHSNMQGCLVRESAGPVRLTQCSLHSNKREGVMVAKSKDNELVLRSCQIFRNGAFGLSLDLGSAARAVDCRVHGNGFWGVIVKSVSYCELQGCEVFSNKCGGIYLGLNGNGRLQMTDCWVHHNLGHGVWDISRDDKLAPVVQRNAHMQASARAMGWQTTSRKPELVATRIEENEARHGHPPRLADWEKRCSMCQQPQGSGQKLMQCGGCRMERYCSAECQKAHWPRHRPTCKLLSAGNKVSVEVHPVEAAYRAHGGSSDRMAAMLLHPLLKVKKNAKSVEERGGNIIVKLQTHENEVDPNQWLIVYDSSRTLNGSIRSPALFNLITDQGVLGANGFTSKKVYAYAQVEEGGKRLHVLTHQLAPLQSW